MEKINANHILKIYNIHIYQIILFCPKMLLHVVQLFLKKANIKPKDKKNSVAFITKKVKNCLR